MRCARCGGLMVADYGELFCINCGRQLEPAHPPPPGLSIRRQEGKHQNKVREKTFYRRGI